MSGYKSTEQVFRFDIETFTWLTGKKFRGLTVSPKNGGWNVIVRAFDGSGRAVYAMSWDSSMEKAALALFSALGTKAGDKLWRHDKFYNPPTRT